MATPKIPTTALFLAEFIRKYEVELNPQSISNVHLFNFHARIYHQVLQNIDCNNYLNENHDPQSLFPRSITMQIDQLLTKLPEIERDVLLYFDYNADLNPLIRKFFKLLRKTLNNRINRITQKHQKENKKSNKKNKKRKTMDHNDNMYSQPHKRQKIDHNFGPYTRKSQLRFVLIFDYILFCFILALNICCYIFVAKIIQRQ